MTKQSQEEFNNDLIEKNKKKYFSLARRRRQLVYLIDPLEKFISLIDKDNKNDKPVLHEYEQMLNHIRMTIESMSIELKDTFLFLQKHNSIKDIVAEYLVEEMEDEREKQQTLKKHIDIIAKEINELKNK